MHQFPKKVLFVALCCLAAWIGGEFSSAQPPPDPLENMECQVWRCQGTEQNCDLTVDPPYDVVGCYTSVPKSCYVTGTNNSCPGTKDGVPCNAGFKRCVLPPEP